MTLTPPAEIQDVVFATDRDGWLVTSGIRGDTATGGDGAIYRTTDGGAHWTQVWRGGETSLRRIGLLPASGHLYAAGTAFSTRHPDGTPVWLTSADGGDTWTVTEPSVPAPAASPPWNPPPPIWPTLHFDFVSPQVGFATVDPENSYQQTGPVWGTTDGGRTWKALPLPEGLASTGGLDFLNAQDGWITGTTHATCAQLWRTADAGRTWHPVPGSCPQFGLYSVHFVDAAHGFAAGGVIPFIGAQAAIMVTTDGGATWHTVYHTQGPKSSGPITHLAFSSPTQGWAWGGMCKMGENGPCAGAVLVTSDGGRVWTATTQGALRLSAVGEQAWTTVGILAVRSAIGHTTDGGAHWTQDPHPATYDLCCLRPVPGSPGTVQLQHVSSPDGTPGGTYTNRAGTAAWTQVPADPFAAGEGSYVWRVWSNVLFRYGRNRVLQVSSDDGRTWQSSLLPSGMYNPNGFAFSSAFGGWAVAQDQGCRPMSCAALLRTQDGGRTWSQAARLPMDPIGATVAATARVGVVLSSIVGSPQTGTVAVSIDGGATWTASPLPAGAECWGPAVAGTSIWLPCRTTAYSGLILHSTDGGATWTEQTSRTVVPRSVVMTDPTHGWMMAAGQGTTSVSLYRTTDGGARWIQLWPSLAAG